MLIYKDPITLNQDIEHQEIKNIISIFRSGNYGKAKQELSQLDRSGLKGEALDNVLKLDRMLKIDLGGVMAASVVLAFVFYLFIAYIQG